MVFITDLDAYICQDEPKLIYFIVSDHVANMKELLLPSSYPQNEMEHEDGIIYYSWQ